jgi:hypothetical protein
MLYFAMTSFKSFRLSSRNDKLFQLSLVLVFLILSTIGILHHEMWRDELQAWLIARDSESIIDLFRNVRYEGHPALWHLCLYLLSRVTRNPVIMQFFHLGIATTSIYLIAVYSPFSRLQKSLISFGYFSFYEYCLISRCYALGVLFTFLFCILFKAQKKNYLLLFSLLALLANTSFYGTMLAIAFAATLLIEYRLNKGTTFFERREGIKLVLGVFIFMFSLFCVVAQVLPPADSIINTPVAANGDLLTSQPGQIHIEVLRAFRSGLKRFLRTFVTISSSYIPLPNPFIEEFWNSNLFTFGQPWGILINFLFSLILLSLAIICFSRQPIVLFLYCLGTTEILLFKHFMLVGYLRHHGHLFILLLACFWISNNLNSSRPLSSIFFNKKWLQKISSRRFQNTFLVSLLWLHCIATLIAFRADLLMPFSASGEVARFIKHHQWNNALIIGIVDYAASPLAAHLDREIYYPAGDRLGTFIIWDQKRKENTADELVKNIRKVQANHHTDTLLVLSSEAKPLDLGLNNVEVTEFSNSIISSEKYHLYHIR